MSDDHVREMKIGFSVAFESDSSVRFEHTLDLLIQHMKADLESDADGSSRLEDQVAHRLRVQLDAIDTRSIARKLLGGKT